MKSKSKQAPPRSGSSPKKTSKAPAAISYKTAANAGKISSGPSNGSIRVRRTEFVGTLTNGSTTGYSLIGLSALTPGYDFNPACGTLFPWLSTVSTSYERFKFHELKFRITPSQATSTPGRLYLAVDYDYDDAPAESKLAMMSNQTHQEGSVWEQLVLSTISSELHSDGKTKYISHHTRANFVEPRTAYCGYLMVAVDSPNANLLFDLEVAYDVELTLPVMDIEPVIGSTTSSAATFAFGSNIVNGPFITGIVARALGGVTTVPEGQSVVSKVTSGTPGVCPVLNYFGDATTPVPTDGAHAFDLTRLKDRGAGALVLDYLLTATGLTPLAVRTTNLVKLKAHVFDSLGRYLSELSPFVDPEKVRDVVSLDPGADASVVSSPLRMTWAMVLKNLFADFPTAKFLVPVVSTAIAMGGAGSVKGSVRYAA